MTKTKGREVAHDTGDNNWPLCAADIMLDKVFQTRVPRSIGGETPVNKGLVKQKLDDWENIVNTPLPCLTKNLGPRAL